MDTPNILPLPNSSRTEPKIVSAIAKPNPIPKPSIMDENGLFFEAKDSARPKTIQLTTISGINKPNDSNNAGTYASIAICTMVTNVAITTIKAGMRTLSGIRFLINEITRFDITNTKVVANPIPNPFEADEVTPNVGHIPNSKVNTAFSLKKPFEKLLH